MRLKCGGLITIKYNIIEVPELGPPKNKSQLRIILALSGDFFLLLSQEKLINIWLLFFSRKALIPGLMTTAVVMGICPHDTRVDTLIVAPFPGQRYDVHSSSECW